MSLREVLVLSCMTFPLSACPCWVNPGDVFECDATLPQGASTSNSSSGIASSTTAIPGETSDPSGHATEPTTTGTTGTPTVCGDGVLADDEECDLGPHNDDAGACKTDCTLAVCGDGLVGPGEACDDGNESDADDCSSACTLPLCGNGVTEGGEECDDGNAVETDLCTSACERTFCGDGEEQLVNGDGQLEQCDDGNDDDDDQCHECERTRCGDGVVQTPNGFMQTEECDDETDQCSSNCKLEFRLVFVTSQGYLPSEIGGVTGADEICRTHAAAGGLGGDWKAWITGEDAGSAPASRFVKSTVQYNLVGGIKVAENWNDLVDGKLLHAIDRSESGGALVGEPALVHTNTLPNGTQAAISSCSDWMDSNLKQYSLGGWWHTSDEGWTTGSEGSCSKPGHLYCFQQ